MRDSFRTTAAAFAVVVGIALGQGIAPERLPPIKAEHATAAEPATLDVSFTGFPSTPLLLGKAYPVKVRRSDWNASTHQDTAPSDVRITPSAKCRCLRFDPPQIVIPGNAESASFTVKAASAPTDAASQVHIVYDIEASEAFADPCPGWRPPQQPPHYCVVTINPFRNVNGHKGFAGIAFVLAANLAIWIVCIVYYVLWKTCRCTDQPGLFIRDPRTISGPPGKGTWSAGGQQYQYITHGEYCTFTERFRTFVSTPCDGPQVHALVGPEAVMYLRLQRDAVWLFLFLSIFGLVVLMPINVVQAKRKGFEGFESTTIKHVPRGSSVLWAHVGFLYMITASVLVYIRYLFRLMLNDRRTAHPWSIVSQHSIFITDGPPPSATGDRLECHLRHLFPSDVLHAVTVPQLGSYLTQYNKYDEKLRGLERANALKRHDSSGTIPICVRVCPGDACCASPGDIIRVYCGWCCGRQRIEDAPDRNTAAASKAEASSLLGRKSIIDAQRLEVELETAHRAVTIAREDLVCNGRALVTFRTRAARQKCINLLPYRGDRMLKLLQQGKSLTGARAARTSILNDNLRVAADEAGVQDPEEIIEEARQLRMMDWEIQPAVEPSDIDWHNISRLQRWRVPLFLTVNFLVILLVLVLSSPVAVISAMKQMSFSWTFGSPDNPHPPQQDEEQASSSPLPGFLNRLLKQVGKMDPNVEALLFQFLPPLYLVIVNYLLMMTLFYAARIEPHFTETGKMLSTMKKSFSYLLFSSLILPCIGVASVSILVHHVFSSQTDRYHAFVDAVSSFFVTACGEFFVNYLSQRTWRKRDVYGLVVHLIDVCIGVCWQVDDMAQTPYQRPILAVFVRFHNLICNFNFN
eukprot:g7542.t1